MTGLGAAAAWLRSLAGLPTSLPPESPDGGGDDSDEHPTWDGGWWLGARRRAAHRGRVGGAIRPWLVVVHTTDVGPSDRTWSGMMDRLERQPGEGNGAHFWIGRDAGQGLVQSVPVDRNANHAGGPDGRHGWLVVDGKRRHPNREAIGIEVSGAGLVLSRGGKWYARSGGSITGAPIPAADVEVDPRHPDRGWHRPSDYQLAELALLLAAIGDSPVLVAAPSRWEVLAHVRDDRVSKEPVYGPPVADAPRVLIGGVPVVGHWTLDPGRKGDPWPPLSRWLQGRSG